MAQAGVYAPGPVIDADVTVRVNGVVREHVSMDWAGDTTGGLPEQVVSAGTGMRSRTGTILWAHQDPVEVEPPHPLRQAGGWPPREGDEVVIDATVDTGQGPYSFRRFTGRLGRTTGSLTDGTLTSAITDTLGDQLRNLATVPPTVSTGYTRSHWAMYQALAQAGLGAIPGPDGDTVLWNGYQGGNTPLIGDLVQNGIMYGDAYGLETATSVITAPDSTLRSSRDVLVVSRAGTGAGSPTPSVSLRIGPTVITLTYSHATDHYTLSVSGTGTIGTWPRRDDSPLPLLAFRVSGVGIRVYTSPTTASDVTTVVIPQSDIVEQAGGTAIAGVSVRYTSSAAAARVVASTSPFPVSIRRSGLEQEEVMATRGFENVRARLVVDSWSEATLSSVWMDEYGKTLCIARDRLLATPVSRPLRIDERVFTGSWSVGDDSVVSAVIVKGEQSTTQRPRPNADLAVIYQEGSTRSFEEPMTIERFIEAPSEMEWGPIDTTPSHFGIDPMLGSLPGAGTWVAAVSTLSDSNDSPETWAHQSGIIHTATIERLGQRTLKVTESISGVPAGRTVYLKTPLVGTQISPVYRGVSSPTIRGRWTTTWTDFTVTGASTGPDWADELTHDSSWWLTPADAQRVADALSVEVTQPMPTLSRVDVLWDPTRQIGDVEEWTAVDKAGVESWRARVLVTGYSEAWDGNVPSQSVDVRVISWTDPIDGKTYGDLAAAYARYSNMSGTYQQVYDALPSPR